MTASNGTDSPELDGSGPDIASARPRRGEPHETRVAAAKALVLMPELRGRPAGGGRSPEDRLDEAVGLTRAIALDVRHAEVIKVNRPQPSTLIGGGAVERLKGLIAEFEIEVAIVDAALAPVQQRNLERAWSCKVIDRTGLILEIFGARARTHEGRLQVELASLSYQRSRLVRSWTHLERQRGGFGFLGGPGESQLEMDRRLIDERIDKIKRELEDVKRTRALHRRARQRVPYPVVALVGYTNAGKSTRFNRLARADVMAENLLFATLDPTMRRVELPSGQTIILSDTVGFISELPTHLVAAFRATLEEVREADILVHVRDCAHPESQAQRDDVLAVLDELDLENPLDGRMIEALNTIDRLGADERRQIENQAARDADMVAISAITGDGVTALLDRVDRLLAARRQVVELSIDLADGAEIAWLYRHGEVLQRDDDERHAHMRVGLAPADLARFEARRGQRPS